MRCCSARSSSRSIGPSNPSRCSAGAAGTRGGTVQSSHSGSPVTAPGAGPVPSPSPRASLVSHRRTVRPDIECECRIAFAQHREHRPGRPVRRPELDFQPGRPALPPVRLVGAKPHMAQRACRAPVCLQPGTARRIVRPALQDVGRHRDDGVQIERAQRSAGHGQDALMVRLDGAAQVPRQHARSGGGKTCRTIRRLHQRVHLVFFPVVKVGIDPGDHPGAGGGRGAAPPRPVPGR